MLRSFHLGPLGTVAASKDAFTDPESGNEWRVHDLTHARTDEPLWHVARRSHDSQ
jgi:hypothetical protein